MGFHGVVRATEDVDMFVRADAHSIERLRAALREVYPDDPHIDDITEADLLGDYPAVRYYPAGGDLYFDILTRLDEVARFDSVPCEVKTVEGVCVTVATPAALYALKRDTVPAIDRQDAEALKQRFRTGGGLTCRSRGFAASRR